MSGAATMVRMPWLSLEGLRPGRAARVGMSCCRRLRTRRSGMGTSRRPKISVRWRRKGTLRAGTGNQLTRSPNNGREASTRDPSVDLTDPSVEPKDAELDALMQSICDDVV